MAIRIGRVYPIEHIETPVDRRFEDRDRIRLRPENTFGFNNAFYYDSYNIGLDRISDPVIQLLFGAQGVDKEAAVRVLTPFVGKYVYWRHGLSTNPTEFYRVIKNVFVGVTANSVFMTLTSGASSDDRTAMEELYIITAPGRRDSDNIVQKTPPSFVPVQPKVLEKGSAEVLDYRIQGKTPDLVSNYTIGDSVSLLTVQGDQSYISCTVETARIFFDDYSNGSQMRMDGHIWRIEHIISTLDDALQSFDVALIRSLPEV